MATGPPSWPPMPSQLPGPFGAPAPPYYAGGAAALPQLDEDAEYQRAYMDPNELMRCNVVYCVMHRTEHRRELFPSEESFTRIIRIRPTLAQNPSIDWSFRPEQLPTPEAAVDPPGLLFTARRRRRDLQDQVEHPSSSGGDDSPDLET